jgi:two-component system cell cycle sensor histidine kinase/response regulator CckA
MVSGADLFLSLFSNLAIFIVLIAIYGFLNGYLQDAALLRRQAVLGVCFGLFAVACMYVRIPVAEGVIVDQRNTMIALSGGFGGPFSAAISALLAGVYRVYLGGSGAFGGVIGVCLSALAGIGFYLIRDKVDTVAKAAACALGATIVILPGFLFIGDFAKGWDLMVAMALPYGSAVYIGLLFIGLLLVHEEHRHTARLEQQQSENRYRELVESTDDLITKVDPDGRFIFINHKANDLLGLMPEECIGLSAFDFIHDEDREPTMTWFNEVIDKKSRIASIESRSVSRAGVVRNLMWTCTFSYDGQGNFLSANGIARDITKRKRAEEEKERLGSQLRQAQKMEAVGTLAGGIAHDFNNILTAIIGYSDLALHNAETGQANTYEINQILKAGDHAKDLVTQILAFSRRLELEMQPVDLNQVVNQTMGMLGRIIPKMVDIDLYLEEKLWAINADSSQLSQVLMNLGSNANDAMPEGGRITIETANITLDENYIDQHIETFPGDYVQLTFSDTGLGMDSETLEYIFDPFFTDKEVGKGTGLGLATVYGIVKTHGGSVLCYSEVGQGTSFKILLPAAQSVEPLEISETDSGQEIPGGGETVLLVDDEGSLRDLEEQLLSSHGYQVLAAETGEEGLATYKEKMSEIDLIVLDISMPGMGGHKCFQELIKINRQVKVIIASGYSRKGQLKDTLASGAAGFIPKPFGRKEFLKTVRDALDA